MVSSHADVALAAPHPAAVEAGRAVVVAGGNAIDAALAAAAVLTVVYPHQCSIGGDLIAVVRPAGQEPRAVVSAGAAAAAIDLGGARSMPSSGPLTVTVPGVVAGWAAVAGLGARLGWPERLEPAAALARTGVPVSAGLARALETGREVIDGDAGLRAVFGAAREGGPLVQPALAGSLAALAADWRSFYTGDLGRRLIEGVRRLGSPLSATDFAAHRAEVGAPLTTRAHGAVWAAAPPPSQGATFLAIVGSDRLLADARRAQLARDALLGDPRSGPIDLPGLLLQNDAIPTAHAAGPPATGDTVAVTAVGSDGTAVSLIQSVFQSFGAGLLEPGTGIVLHNRGSMFRLDPAHPGRLAPGARPPHTLCPTVAVAGDTVLALGCQGGRSQPWILAQLAGDALHGDDPAAVVSRPRWIIGSGDRPAVVLEPGVPGAGDLTTTARALGLPVTTAAGPHDDAGHVQLARLRGTRLDAASDPRADGPPGVL
jgi:gamma-glutamyltranspeptidase